MVMIPGPKPAPLKRWQLNPWEVQVEDETEEMVYCEYCDVMLVDVSTRWITGENVGEAECPICEAVIEVIPDECY